MEIKPIEQILTTDGVHVVQIKIYNPHEVRQMEIDFKEAIEALEELVIESMNNYDDNYSDNIFRQTSKQIHSEEISIIEKAYGESWKDIRREK